MDQTANLGLAYIVSQQAQKYVTHNTALRDIDSLLQLAVLDRDLATPPSTPAAGDRYLVAASATGAWSGQSGRIAAFQDGLWLFYVPQKGWRVWVDDEAVLIAWTGSAWAVANAVSINPAPMIGILATADTTNRLAVKSNAVLFANDDVTPGTGDIRVNLTKASSGKTASFLFQDAWSGRAEFGLTGDDHFHLKVSPDGSSWSEAICATNSTGRIGLGTTSPTSRLTASDNAAALPSPPAGTVGHWGGADGANARLQLDAFGNASYAPILTFRHARGTAASPSAVQSGDQLLSVAAYGYGATGYSSGSRSGVAAVAAENWSDSAQGSYFTVSTTPTGSTTATERLRVNSDGALLTGAGTQTLVNASGIVCLRSYTVTTLPSASTAGQLIYVSNGTANKRLAVSDGTNWRFPDGNIVS